MSISRSTSEAAECSNEFAVPDDITPTGTRDTTYRFGLELEVDRAKKCDTRLRSACISCSLVSITSRRQAIGTHSVPEPRLYFLANDNILGESLKPLSIFLLNSNCYVDRLAGLDISHGVGFA